VQESASSCVPAAERSPATALLLQGRLESWCWLCGQQPQQQQQQQDEPWIAISTSICLAIGPGRSILRVVDFWKRPLWVTSGDLEDPLLRTLLSEPLVVACFVFARLPSIRAVEKSDRSFFVCLFVCGAAHTIFRFVFCLLLLLLPLCLDFSPTPWPVQPKPQPAQAGARKDSPCDRGREREGGTRSSSSTAARSRYGLTPTADDELEDDGSRVAKDGSSPRQRAQSKRASQLGRCCCRHGGLSIINNHQPRIGAPLATGTCPRPPVPTTTTPDPNAHRLIHTTTRPKQITQPAATMLAKAALTAAIRRPATLAKVCM
jgi:hypothetical protein